MGAKALYSCAMVWWMWALLVFPFASAFCDWSHDPWNAPPIIRGSRSGCAILLLGIPYAIGAIASAWVIGWYALLAIPAWIVAMNIGGYVQHLTLLKAR